MTKQDNKVSLDEIKKERPALFKVLEEMSTKSRTKRDVPHEIARDVALMVSARDANSPLKKALDEYEASLHVQVAENDTLSVLCKESPEGE